MLLLVLGSVIDGIDSVILLVFGFDGCVGVDVVVEGCVIVVVDGRVVVIVDGCGNIVGSLVVVRG